MWSRCDWWLAGVPRCSAACQNWGSRWVFSCYTLITWQLLFTLLVSKRGHCSGSYFKFSFDWRLLCSLYIYTSLQEPLEKFSRCEALLSQCFIQCPGCSTDFGWSLKCQCKALKCVMLIQCRLCVSSRIADRFTVWGYWSKSLLAN